MVGATMETSEQALAAFTTGDDTLNDGAKKPDVQLNGGSAK
jgi:hypothetical protein